MVFYSTVTVPLCHDASFAWFLRDAAEYNPNYRKKKQNGLDGGDAYLLNYRI